jgi:hypothetical protein
MAIGIALLENSTDGQPSALLLATVPVHTDLSEFGGGS